MKPFILIMAIWFGIGSAAAQDVKYVRLKQEKSKYAPKQFYIADVVDDREDASSIGTVNAGGKKESLGMQNGVAASLRSYIEANVKQDRSAQPITLHIKTMDARVKMKGQEWDINAQLNFSFYAGDNKVVDLSGKGETLTPEDPAAFYESFIRSTLETDLERFDEWWAQNKGAIVTNTTVKVNVRLAKTIEKPNCIAYSLDKPLHISDFKGPVEAQGYEMAMTASGIGLSFSDQIENGQTVLDLTITPYFDRSKSWFKKDEKSAVILAHEQTHFDIAAIKACELATKIRNTVFSLGNYEQTLEQLQQQNARESRDEEETYDRETNHGTIADKQLEWQKKITEQVRAIGCY